MTPFAARMLLLGSADKSAAAPVSPGGDKPPVKAAPMSGPIPDRTGLGAPAGFVQTGAARGSFGGRGAEQYSQAKGGPPTEAAIAKAGPAAVAPAPRLPTAPAPRLPTAPAPRAYVAPQPRQPIADKPVIGNVATAFKAGPPAVAPAPRLPTASMPKPRTIPFSPLESGPAATRSAVRPLPARLPSQPPGDVVPPIPRAVDPLTRAPAPRPPSYGLPAPDMAAAGTPPQPTDTDLSPARIRELLASADALQSGDYAPGYAPPPVDIEAVLRRLSAENVSTGLRSGPGDGALAAAGQPLTRLPQAPPLRDIAPPPRRLPTAIAPVPRLSIDSKPGPAAGRTVAINKPPMIPVETVRDGRTVGKVHPGVASTYRETNPGARWPAPDDYAQGLVSTRGLPSGSYGYDTLFNGTQALGGTTEVGNRGVGHIVSRVNGPLMPVARTKERFGASSDAAGFGKTQSEIVGSDGLPRMEILGGNRMSMPPLTRAAPPDLSPEWYQSMWRRGVYDDEDDDRRR